MRRLRSMKTVKRFINLTILLLAVMLLWFFKNWIFKKPFLEWSQKSLPPRELEAKHFVLGRDEEVYMYSAFVNIHAQNEGESHSNETNIVITTLDRSRAKLNCCVLYSDRKTLFTTPVTSYYEYNRQSPAIGLYVARQFTCKVPSQSSSLKPVYLTLAASNCSSDIRDYLPIQTPTRVPGGLALCGKIAYSGGIDPEKIIEWFELQRILGVDKVLMFDLGNPENLTRVFRYYQELGILDLQPYELPGLPRNRSLLEILKHTPQFKHDETMAVLECRQRMAGYDYIMSHDPDEFIIPRKDITLKEFLQEKLRQHPTAAGFHFHTQFFITTWEPTNPEEDLMVKRYRLSTVPRWERYKYMYLPSRVITSFTHNFFPTSDKYTKLQEEIESVQEIYAVRERRSDRLQERPAFEKQKREIMPPSEAVLHHYRTCPEDAWGTCSVTTITDDIMTRYRDLDTRVNKVRNATLTRPRWTPIKHTIT